MITVQNKKSFSIRVSQLLFLDLEWRDIDLGQNAHFYSTLYSLDPRLPDIHHPWTQCEKKRRQEGRRSTSFGEKRTRAPTSVLFFISSRSLS